MYVSDVVYNTSDNSCNRTIQFSILCSFIIPIVMLYIISSYLLGNVEWHIFYRTANESVHAGNGLSNEKKNRSFCIDDI